MMGMKDAKEVAIDVGDYVVERRGRPIYLVIRLRGREVLKYVKAGALGICS